MGVLPVDVSRRDAVSTVRRISGGYAAHSEKLTPVDRRIRALGANQLRGDDGNGDNDNGERDLPESSRHEPPRFVKLPAMATIYSDRGKCSRQKS